MFYIKQDLGRGEVNYIRILEDNVYFMCDRCGEMIRLEDPMAEFAEFCSSGSDFDTETHCELCGRVIEMVHAKLEAAKQAEAQNSTVNAE